MLKFLFPLWISAVVIGSYALWHSVAGSLLLGAAAGIGCFTAWRLARRKPPEVTSDTIPTFLPRSLSDQYQASQMKAAATPVDDGGELLPPAPNMGDFGVPYRGPTYFTADQYRKD